MFLDCEHPLFLLTLNWLYYFTTNKNICNARICTIAHVHVNNDCRSKNPCLFRFVYNCNCGISMKFSAANCVNTFILVGCHTPGVISRVRNFGSLKLVGLSAKKFCDELSG